MINMSSDRRNATSFITILSDANFSSNVDICSKINMMCSNMLLPYECLTHREVLLLSSTGSPHA